MILLDVDECLSRRCEHNCTNNYGSFYCSCHDGYELTDQLFCAGQYNCNHCTEFTASDNYVFIDIDECDRGTSKCEQNCYNRLATYYCDCNEGYYLALDQYSCNGKCDTLYIRLLQLQPVKYHYWPLLLCYCRH